MIEYHLPSNVLKLSKVFSLIENHLDELEIEDYSVSQTTLDNVSIVCRKGSGTGCIFYALLFYALSLNVSQILLN